MVTDYSISSAALQSVRAHWQPMRLQRLKPADLAITASDQQCVSTPSNGSGWAGVLSKLGGACRSCVIIEVEDMQGPERTALPSLLAAMQDT